MKEQKQQLLLKVEKKILKGKSLEQIADKLEEEDMIEPFYNQVLETMKK